MKDRMTLYLNLVLGFCVAWTVAVGPEPATAAESIAGVTPIEYSRIRDATARLKSVEPARLRRVLVFSRAWGYKHSAIPFGKAAFSLIAEQTGAFEAVVSDDDAYFEPDRLKQFDAIVLNNTNNEIFLPEDLAELTPAERDEARRRDAMLKDSLVGFLRRGGGLAVIHAGLASFRQWPEFGEIIGARFDNHPWNAGSTVTLTVEEPGHPLLGAFVGARFTVTDEIYQVKDPYSRTRLRVLLSVDTDRTDMNRGNAIHRTDGDFAISWIKRYGKGRVFYCALGHQHDIFWNPTVLKHYLDGLQFVLGDLEAESTRED